MCDDVTSPLLSRRHLNLPFKFANCPVTRAPKLATVLDEIIEHFSCTTASTSDIVSVVDETREVDRYLISIIIRS